MNNNLKSNFEEGRIELLVKISSSVSESTIQFFSDKYKNSSPIGSGVLVTLDSKFFMLTAAHVIAEDYKIYTILPDKELQLGGILLYGPLPKSGKREDDKIDIAIMDLRDDVVFDLAKNYKFISLDNIEIDHIILNADKYLSFGYPASKTKKIGIGMKLLQNLFSI